MVTQTFKNGTRVTFMIKGMTSDFLELLDLRISEAEFIRTYGNKSCVVKLVTYTSLGDPNCEYYDLVFENGLKLPAVSGYHLKAIPWRFNKG